MKINKGQFTLNDFRKNLMFNIHRGHGNLLRYAANRFRWHYYPRFHRVSRFPDHVDIELSSICNLQCPMCYTITDEFKLKVSQKLIDFDLFKKIVDECASYGAYSIRLSYRGEPLMHPKVVEMVRYAKEKGIKEVSTLTNGLKLTPDMFENLMNAGIDWITISVDGLGETYERIRFPAKFDETLEKIKAYKKIKTEKKSVKPVIKVQGLWPAIKEDPQAYFSLFSPLVDSVSANPLIDYLHNDQDILYEKDFICPVLWQRLVIASDGKILLCINDEMGKHVIGDANKESLFDVWHGKNMQEARSAHLNKKGVEKLAPCRDCYLPRLSKKFVESIEGKKYVVENYVNRTQVVGR